MDVPRIIFVMTIAALTALPSVALAAEQEPALQQSTKPVDRGYGQHDACFGDKYEREEDLKTGNEQAVMEILQQMLGPGS